MARLPTWVFVAGCAGTGISPSSVVACYRLYAAYCVDSAQHVSDSGHKVALLDMAQAWSRLAEQIERKLPTIEHGEQSS